MAEGIYTEAPLALRAWLKSIIGDAVVYADHARRFTLTVNDIILSLKKNGATLYGGY
jgi:histone H3/H4